MFDGDAFYCPNQLMFLAPILQHSNIDFEQFVNTLRAAAKQQQAAPDIMSVRNGIAQVNISGPLTPNKSLMMQAMGGTSTTDINTAFQRIKNNPKIKGVYMQVNSGGGSAAGIDETAQIIHDVNQEKPVVAQIMGSSASAAYYLTSQASKVFANSRTNMIGSIGTRLVLDDTSQAAERAGVKRVVIETGTNKSIGLPGTKITAEQQAHMQDQVRTLQNYFEQSVQRGRPNMHISNVNDGSVWLSEEAQRKGLIDGIQTPQQTANVLGALMKIRSSN